MTDVDVARLRRIRASITSALASVTEKSTRGLPPSYVALRGEALSAVPQGLRSEVEKIAPSMNLPEESGSFTRGFDPIASTVNGAEAHAHLAALKGWLDGLIEENV